MRQRISVWIGLFVLFSSMFFVGNAADVAITDVDSALERDPSEDRAQRLLNAPTQDGVSDAPITAAALLNGDAVEGLTANRHFAPSHDALVPAESFEGTLVLQDVTMGTSDDFIRGKGELHSGDTTVFPGVAIDFFTVNNRLVPVTQDVIANGTLANTPSYWDMIVQPGMVWEQADGSDNGWYRAAFPFALVNRLEGETHTGVALFLYNGDAVSHLRFQVVAQTGPFDVEDFFNAWGVTEASYEPGGIDELESHRARYIRHMESRLPTAPLSDLANRVDPHLLDGFDGARDASEKARVLQTGLYVDGVLYHSECETAAGPFPYCDDARYGVWSVTKSTILNVALLRLAEKYGVDVLDELIADYVTEAQSVAGWENVTYLDMANMAAGRGATEDDPTCYLCDYRRWYEAPSKAEKVAEALDYPLFWEPGTKYMYRDQDAFLLSVALEAYIQNQEGDDASLHQFLMAEVFEPIGIYYLPANYTISADGKDEHLRGDFGHYPSFDDLAKIALLYHNHGVANGEQILHRELVNSLLPDGNVPAMALPKEGSGNEFGATHYAMNWHIEPYVAVEGCQVQLPTMSGYGGNAVTLLPGGAVALRAANADIPEAVPFARVANELVPFCAH